MSLRIIENSSVDGGDDFEKSYPTNAPNGYRYGGFARFVWRGNHQKRRNLNFQTWTFQTAAPKKCNNTILNCNFSIYTSSLNSLEEGSGIVFVYCAGWVKFFGGGVVSVFGFKVGSVDIFCLMFWWWEGKGCFCSCCCFGAVKWDMWTDVKNENQETLSHHRTLVKTPTLS